MTAPDCPRARTQMTPCVARHGRTAADNAGECVGCGWHFRTVEAGQAPDGPRPPRDELPSARLAAWWDAIAARRRHP